MWFDCVRFGDEDNPDPVVHPCKGLFQTCCSVKADEPQIPKIEKKVGCGHRNNEGVGFRITGDRDNESQYGEFPWMVAIIKEEQSLESVLNVYQCGGSLIHPLVCIRYVQLSFYALCSDMLSKSFNLHCFRWC